jgi:ankyrin repeat protein
MSTFRELVGAVYRKELTVLGELSDAEANLTDSDGRTLVMHAVLASDADPAVVAVLLGRGTDVNAADAGQEWTALHFAARDLNEGLVRLLLDAGADVDAVDVFGNTPLWRAVGNAGTGLGAVGVLLRHGADPLRKNRRGTSPLDLARGAGRNDVVALLESFRHP